MQCYDIKKYWNNSLVSFFFGCSFGFENSLIEAGIPVRHIQQKTNVPMFKTNRNCVPVGPFSSVLVVSYRSIPKEMVDLAIQITKCCKSAHGPPVHVGDPSVLGIMDLNKPDFGDSIRAEEGDIPVFWACGVTSTLAALSSHSDMVITHSPGHMFVTDLKLI